MVIKEQTHIKQSNEEHHNSEWKELKDENSNTPKDENVEIAPAFPDYIKEFIEQIQTQNLIAEEILEDLDIEIANAIPYNATRNIKITEHQVFDKKIYIIKDRVILETLPLNLLFNFLTTFMCIIFVFKLVTTIMDKYNAKYKKIFISFLTFGTPLILAATFQIWSIFIIYSLLFLSLMLLIFVKRNRFLIRNTFYAISSIFVCLHVLLIISSLLFLRMIFLQSINVNVFVVFFNTIFITVFFKDFLFLFSDFFQIHVNFTEKGCLLCKKELKNSIVLKCGHSYHYMCLKGYMILQNNKCACCSASINKDIFKGYYEIFDERMNQIINILGNLIGVILAIILAVIWVFWGRIRIAIK